MFFLHYFILHKTHCLIRLRVCEWFDSEDDFFPGCGNMDQLPRTRTNQSHAQDELVC